jgi:hypothetical protein
MALTKVTSGVRTIASSEVVTASIADDAVTAAKIADDAITLAKMAPGTDGNLITYDASGNPAAVATGSSGQILTSQGAGAAPVFASVAANITLATRQATTSGSAIDFTGIPAGTKRINLLFAGVSTNGTANLLVTIGDAGGLETSGYLSSVSYGTSEANTTAAFLAIAGGSAAAAWSGAMTLQLGNAATFSWVSSSILTDGGSVARLQAGSKSLSAELDRLQIKTTDTFDVGSVNISYEG